MSGQATWSTRSTPGARIAEVLLLTLGVFSIVVAAIRLTLGPEWHPAATAILSLAALFVGLRLHRSRLSSPLSLSWCPAACNFRVAGRSDGLHLVRVWQGPGWVTLGLRPDAEPQRVLYLVVWKSAVPAPLWSELILLIETSLQRRISHQNKENP
ncbi:MAG TPA: hypothetical protein VKZ70_05765 [Burkholderiaceae bacterium]|nr:hypothetical protein [Burkholderiaceae bacterium]